MQWGEVDLGRWDSFLFLFLFFRFVLVYVFWFNWIFLILWLLFTILFTLKRWGIQTHNYTLQTPHNDSYKLVNTITIWEIRFEQNALFRISITPTHHYLWKHICPYKSVLHRLIQFQNENSEKHVLFRMDVLVDWYIWSIY